MYKRQVQIQTALDLYAADVRGAHTIVGQRAVDLAALAAGTQVGVDHQKADVYKRQARSC